MLNDLKELAQALDNLYRVQNTDQFDFTENNQRFLDSFITSDELKSFYIRLGINPNDPPKNILVTSLSEGTIQNTLNAAWNGYAKANPKLKDTIYVNVNRSETLQIFEFFVEKNDGADRDDPRFLKRL